jgi:hypothetical protein
MGECLYHSLKQPYALGPLQIYNLGQYVTRSNPFYYPEESEREPTSGLLYSRLVSKTGDVREFRNHVGHQKESYLK